MLLRASFDDSGTHSDSSVAIWAGIVGDVGQYADLESAWQKFLLSPVEDNRSITKWHSVDCLHGRGEFYGWELGARDRARHNARQAIIDSGVVPVSFAVPREAWEQIVAPHAPIPLKSASAPAFTRCGQAAAQLAQRRRTPIACIYDAGQSCENFNTILGWCNTWANDMGVQIAQGFRPVASYIGLQAADCIATENYWVADRVVRGIPVELDAQQRAFFGGLDPISRIMSEDEMHRLAENWHLIEWGAEPDAQA